MLSRSARLVLNRDFRRVYQTGQTSRGRNFRVRAAASGLPKVRVGVVVANTVSKRATERNLIKRHVREAMRPWLPKLRPGVDVVIQANPSAVRATYVDVQQEIFTHLERLQLIAKK